MKSNKSSIQVDRLIEKVLEGKNPRRLMNTFADIVESGSGPYPIGSGVKLNKAWSGSSVDGVSVSLNAGDKVSIVDPHQGANGYEKLVLLADGVTKCIIPLNVLGEAADVVTIIAGDQNTDKPAAGGSTTPELDPNSAGQSVGADAVGSDSSSSPLDDILPNPSLLIAIPSMVAGNVVSGSVDSGPSGHEVPSATGDSFTTQSTVVGLPAPTDAGQPTANAPGTIDGQAQGNSEPEDLGQDVGNTTSVNSNPVAVESVKRRSSTIKAIRLYMESCSDVVYRRLDKVLRKLSETTNTSAINKCYTMMFQRDASLEELEGVFGIREQDDQDPVDGDPIEGDDSGEPLDNEPQEQDDSDQDVEPVEADDTNPEDPEVESDDDVDPEVKESKKANKGQTKIIESVFSKYDSFGK